MDSKRRVDWIDTCKGIAIILVILGHCISRMGTSRIESVINLMIYSFHMPLFFFVSGVNLKIEYSLKKYVEKRIKGILLPGYLFMIIMLIYKIIVTQGNTLVGRELKDVYYFCCMTNKSIISEYWFLPALFTGEILCFFLYKIIRKEKVIVIISIFIFMTGIVEKNIFDIQFPFCLETGAVALMFILVGYLYKEKRDIVNVEIRSKTFIVMACLFLAGNIVQCACRLGKVSFYSLEIRNIVTFFINSVSGIICSIALAKKINYQLILSYLGRKSLYVFGFHYLFLEICCKLDEVQRKVINMKGSSFVFTIIITFLCYFVCKIMDRIMERDVTSN